MKIEWSRAAQAHLDEIIARSRDFGLLAPPRLIARVDQAVRRLSDHPYAARIGRVDGTRELVLRPVPYIVVYRVAGDTLTILAFHHAARDWPAEFPGS